MGKQTCKQTKPSCALGFLGCSGIQRLASRESSQKDLEDRWGRQGHGGPWWWSMAAVRGGGPQHRRTHLPSFRGFRTEKNRTASSRSLGMIRSLRSDGYIGGVWLNNRKSFTSAGVLSLSPIPFAAEWGSCCQTWVLLFEWRLSALLLELIPLPRG